MENKDSTVEIISDQADDEPVEKSALQKVINNASEQQITVTDNYLIQIIGPGLNTRLEVNELDDLIIVEAMLSKIKKKLQNGTD